MILVSELAKAALRESLDQSGMTRDQALRLTGSGGSFTLEVDQPTEDDRIIRYKDSPVIIVDQKTAEEVGDAIIDIQDSAQGPALIFQRISSGNHQP
jgi:hypothetical protein